MSDTKLVLEFINGPLDGHVVTLESETLWCAKGKGPLICPWDAELGDLQARLFPKAQAWWLEGCPAPHGTYRGSGEPPKRVEADVQLEVGDVLMVSETWLLVREVG